MYAHLFADCYEDELRVYTHDMSHCLSFGPKCDCFTCQARPFKEARMREAWEGETVYSLCTKYFIYALIACCFSVASQDGQEGGVYDVLVCQAGVRATGEK